MLYNHYLIICIFEGKLLMTFLNNRKIGFLAAMLTLSAFTTAVNATVVEFEDIISSGTYLSTSGPDTVDGMVFSYSGSTYFMENYNTTDANSPVDPTGSIFTYSNNIITMSQLGGSAFSLNSFDAGIYLNQNDALITLVGSYDIGGTVSDTFEISPNDWLTFNLSSAWSNLESVTFQMTNSSFIQYDNIVYDDNPIPEPTVLAILGLGLAGLGLRRRK